MKGSSKLFSLVTALLMFICALAGCKESEKAPSAAAPVSETPVAEASENPTLPASTAQSGVPSSFAEPAERNEIKLLLPFGSEADAVYSYRFNELPEYDSAAEASYTFSGTRIRLCAYQALGAGFYNHIDGRSICDQIDHSFVSGVISALDFTDYSLPDDAGKLLINSRVLMFITVESESGESIVYIVGDDLRVMRSDRAYPYEEFPCSAVTAISTEPLKDEEFRHLLAMSLHYMNGELLLTGLLTSFVEDYHSVYDSTAVEIALEDAKTTLTDKAEIDALLERYGLFETGEIAQMRCTHECPFDITSGSIAMTFTGPNTYSGRIDVPHELTFYIMPDDTLAVQLKFLTLGAGEIGTPDYLHYASADFNMICFGTEKKASYEELKKLMVR